LVRAIRKAHSALAPPDNVRELENVISSACITAMGDFIDIPDLPDQLRHRGSGQEGAMIGGRCLWTR
jgi:DNA-binding NtrC family response regulator